MQLSKTPFMQTTYHGIQAAVQKLNERGIQVFLRSAPDADEIGQLKQLDALEKLRINGLAMMPVDSDNVRIKLNAMIQNGVKVITFNSDIVGTGRICFVGLDNRKSGQTAAGLMSMLTQKHGKVLIITGNFSNNIDSMRLEGFVDTIHRCFPAMNMIGVQASYDNDEEVKNIINKTMHDFPDLAGIFVVSGGQNGIEAALKSMHLKKRPAIIVYDQTPSNEKALQDDVIDFVIDQGGYMQGYRSLKLLMDCLEKRTDFKPGYYYTDICIKTKYNL